MSIRREDKKFKERNSKRYTKKLSLAKRKKDKNLQIEETRQLLSQVNGKNIYTKAHHDETSEP